MSVSQPLSEGEQPTDSPDLSIKSTLWEHLWSTENLISIQACYIFTVNSMTKSENKKNTEYILTTERPQSL